MAPASLGRRNARLFEQIAMTASKPPLNAIRAFEVAARRKTFSRAADELGVTQGAVSKQVIALEDFIGTQLFERLPTGLSLTEEGKALQSSLSPAFASIDAAFDNFRRRAPRERSCRVATIASFASHFLAPRLDAFESAFPDIRLQVLSSDRVLDLSREEIDFGVRYGVGDWDGIISEPLLPGRLAPVCAPHLLEEADGDLQRLLRNNRRIEIFTRKEWSAHDAFGDAPKSEFVAEDFLVALAAAKSGQGLVLAPDILVWEAIKSEELVYFSDIRIDWPQTYHIAYLPGAERKPHIRAITEWLKAEMANAPQ